MRCIYLKKTICQSNVTYEVVSKTNKLKYNFSGECGG